MSLKEQLAQDLKDAIRAGDEVRKSTLRAVITEIQKAEVPQVVEHRIAEGDTWAAIAAKYGADPSQLAVAYKAIASDPIPKVDEDSMPLTKLVVRLPAAPLTDENVQAIVAKQVKQRRDSIDAFKKANRPDLVDKESAELRILEAYLPAQMGRDEIAAEARAVIMEMGASRPSDKGKVMSTLMPRLAGRAEGRMVNEVVTELLAGA
jgi:hypothetical protein